jgi:hypothetical protein
MRKCAIVPPPPDAVPLHVPAFAFAPEDAFASQSDGSVIEQRTVPESADAQFEGAAPMRSFRIGAVPISVSIASRRALRVATANWIAMCCSCYVNH